MCQSTHNLIDVLFVLYMLVCQYDMQVVVFMLTGPLGLGLHFPLCSTFLFNSDLYSYRCEKVLCKCDGKAGEYCGMVGNPDLILNISIYQTIANTAF
jgi:hypothetical protein